MDPDTDQNPVGSETFSRIRIRKKSFWIRNEFEEKMSAPLKKKVPITMRPLFFSQKINALKKSDEFIALAHLWFIDNLRWRQGWWFAVENMVDTIKFGLSLWCLTYIGSWFNATTLIILGTDALLSASYNTSLAQSFTIFYFKKSWPLL